jgi:predicted DNA-binding transcriptional regulator AlpA
MCLACLRVYGMDEHMTAAGSITRKLSVKETAAYLSVSKSWLDKRRLDGNGPTYLKFGRRVVYDIIDLENWAASNRRRHTSESTCPRQGI